MSNKRKIRITAIRRQEPDIRLFVQALIELARQQLAEEEARAVASGTDGDDQEDES